ncbi:hypothetical protein [Aquimarina algiphila]|uniref:hypothetical protein n=1 Tax=Aquimarina algiphila TaxID=2047982 RepID=UPI00232F3860|nr:hypothetical protein [Aquimarina algiphila]
MTENVELNKRRNEFLAPIIQFIQLEMDEFMMCVANKECHEMMIYRWAIRLFERGASSDYAIGVIHRARRFVLINKADKYTPKRPIRTLQKISEILNQHPKYIKLDDHAKTIVQNDIIEAVLSNDPRIKPVEEALQTTNFKLDTEAEDNTLTIIHVLASKVMNIVRKIELTRYWKNISNH